LKLILKTDFRSEEYKKREYALNWRLGGMLFILCFFFVILTHGQTASETDTLSNSLSYTDSSFTNDTITFHPDDEILSTSRNLFDTIRKKAAKYKWTKKLHDMLIVENKQEEAFEKREIDQVFNPFRKYSGRIIDSIRIRRLEVFGPSLSDTAHETQQWYKDFGNYIHFPTNKSIIRENLLFSAHDSIDPTLLADNERIIRNLRFIKDARIIVEEVPGNPEKVYLTVLTQDQWSKGFNVDMNSINAGEIELYDNNIFGIGHKFQGNIIFDYLKRGNPGIESFYKVTNFRGTFINGRIYYMNSFETNRYGIELDRGFYSYKTRYVGGFKIYKTNTENNIEKIDTTLNNVDLNYVEHDVWFGRAFRLPAKKGIFKKRTRLVLSARYDRERFIEGPEVTERYNYKYHDNYMFLGSISFSRQNFYESELIYGYGKTEDIPVGDLFTYTFGWEADQFFKRYYSGIEVKHGHFFNSFGYLSSSLNVGGFIYQNDFEQGTLDFQAKYISKLLYVKDYRVRQFFNLHYTRGINRFSEDYLEFDSYTDMRGYDNPDLHGKKKLVFRSETVAFSDLYYYGFRFAFFGFLDMGFIGSSNNFILNNPIQPGFGIGLRMRNENLVFKTFQIRLGFYPSLSNGDNFLFYISGEKSLEPHRYTPDAPSKVTY